MPGKPDREIARELIQIDGKTIDEVFNSSLEALAQAQEQLFQIAENVRQEYARVELELGALKKELTVAIEEVDKLEVAATRSRTELTRVNKDFSKYSEQEIKRVYEEAHDFMMKLVVAREREKSLRIKRDNLERSLLNLKEMVEHADQMVSRVGVAVEYLRGGVNQLEKQLSTWRQRYELGASIIRAQEEERRRVAREIHDGPAQSMANVVLRAEICERLIDTDLGELRSELRSLKDMVKTSLGEIRRIIFDLRPMTLDDLGLVATLRRYVEEAGKGPGPFIELIVLGDEDRLEPAIEVSLFRVAQEAINNARKHSGASNIVVKYEAIPAEVRLVVEDDGRGFEPEAAAAQASRTERFGLSGMKERISLLGGEFSILSRPGKGTRVSARVPRKAGSSEPTLGVGIHGRRQDQGSRR